MTTCCFYSGLLLLPSSISRPRATEVLRDYQRQPESVGVVGGELERRKGTRFNVRTPAIFSWLDEQGKQNEGAGFTRDIAIDSVFVWSHTLFPLEQTKMSIEVLLPKLSQDVNPMRFCGEGTVARVERESLNVGFALVFSAESAFLFSNSRGIPEMLDQNESHSCEPAL